MLSRKDHKPKIIFITNRRIINMIKGYKAKTLNQELKAIANDFVTQYNIRRDASEKAYKTTLTPGQIFHSKNGFYEDVQRNLFNSEADEFRNKAHAVLDNVALELMDETTKAPTIEALNAITLLANRKDITADEIDMFMTKYGQDCPLAYKALKEIAESHNYHDFADHPLGEQAENVQILANSIDRTFSPGNAEYGNIEVSVAGFCANVDQAFPAE